MASLSVGKQLAEVATVDSVRNPQMKLFSQCITQRRNDTRWLAFVDADEFIMPIAQKCIPHLLQDYERFPGLLVSWVFFGSNGHIFESGERVLTSHPRFALSHFTFQFLRYSFCLSSGTVLTQANDIKAFLKPNILSVLPR